MIDLLITAVIALVAFLGFDLALVNEPSLARAFNLSETMETGITIGRVNADLAALAAKLRLTHDCTLGRVLVADYPFAPITGCNGTANFPIIVEKSFKMFGAKLDVGCRWGNCTEIPGSDALEVCMCDWGKNGTGITLIAALAPLKCSRVLDKAKTTRDKRAAKLVVALVILGVLGLAALVTGSMSMKGVKDLAAATQSDLDSMLSLIHSTIYSESTATRYFDCDKDGECKFNGNVRNFIQSFEGDWFSGFFAGLGSWFQNTFGIVWYYFKWVALGAGVLLIGIIMWNLLTCIVIPMAKAGGKLIKKGRNQRRGRKRSLDDDNLPLLAA